ncbi:UNVERIFIED_CONTAM: hypothetical protein FKN15_017942 [Acipenser sinensis]
MGRRSFAKEVIFDFLGLTAEQIFCYRDFPLRNTFETTFMGDYLCQDAWNKCLEHKDEAPIANFNVEPLFASRVRTVTVCMQNPYVKEQDIRSFLSKYCDVLGVGTKEIDYDGLWNGNRKYAVRFRTRMGGIEYPPASFYIGGVKGYLYFYGQPKTCRKCGEEGHIAAMCPNSFCRNCLETGHLARDCNKPKSCNLCDSTEHVFKDCPGRHKTYAESLRDIEVVLDEVLRDHAPVDVEECAEAGDTLRGTLPTASPVAISREAPADKSESRTAGHPVAGTSATGETNKKLATHVGTQPEKMTIEESSQGTEIPDTPVEGRVQWGDTEGDKEMDWKKAEGKKTAKRKITNERLDKDNKVQVIETSNKFGALENEETGDEGVQSSELSLTGESPLAPPVTPSEDGSDGSMESQPEYLSDTMMDNLKTTMILRSKYPGSSGGRPGHLGKTIVGIASRPLGSGQVHCGKVIADIVATMQGEDNLRGKNTLRFQLKSLEEKWVRKRFVREILFSVLNLEVKDIFCLFDFEERGMFDVVLDSESLCWEKMKAFSEKKELEPVSGMVEHIVPGFRIGPYSGTVSYAGQPKLCFRCSSSEHVAAECMGMSCSLCKQGGHAAKDCKMWTGKCNLCMGKGHQYKNCPKGAKAKTYAQAAGGSKKTGGEEGKKEQQKEQKGQEKEKEKEKDKGANVGGGSKKNGGGMAGNPATSQTKGMGGAAKQAAKEKLAENAGSKKKSWGSEVSSSSEEEMELNRETGVREKKRKAEDGKEKPDSSDTVVLDSETVFLCCSKGGETGKKRKRSRTE